MDDSTPDVRLRHHCALTPDLTPVKHHMFLGEPTIDTVNPKPTTLQQTCRLNPNHTTDTVNPKPTTLQQTCRLNPNHTTDTVNPKPTTLQQTCRLNPNHTTDMVDPKPTTLAIDTELTTQQETHANCDQRIYIL